MAIVFAGMTVKLTLDQLAKDRRPGLLGEGGKLSAYLLVKAAEAVRARRKDLRVSDATLYRLARQRAGIESVRGDTLELLADVFGCDIPDLFERKRGKR